MHRVDRRVFDGGGAGGGGAAAEGPGRDDVKGLRNLRSVAFSQIKVTSNSRLVSYVPLDHDSLSVAPT